MLYLVSSEINKHTWSTRNELIVRKVRVNKFLPEVHWTSLMLTS